NVRIHLSTEQSQAAVLFRTHYSEDSTACAAAGDGCFLSNTPTRYFNCRTLVRSPPLAGTSSGWSVIPGTYIRLVSMQNTGLPVSCMIPTACAFSLSINRVDSGSAL